MGPVRFVAPPSSHDYCLKLIRTFDNENFVINTLLRTRAERVVHYALRAFNVELARIRYVVSNEDLGRLRIQFFRDALNDITEAQTAWGSSSTSSVGKRSPVVEVLAEAASDCPQLDLRALHTLLDARERDLSYPNFATLSELSSFAADTHGSLIHAHFSAISPPYVSDTCPTAHSSPDTPAERSASSYSASPHCTHASGTDTPALGPPTSLLPLWKMAARHAGEAVGLAVLLRGAPAHAASRLSYAPADVMREEGASAAELLSGSAAAECGSNASGRKKDKVGSAARVFERVAMRAERGRLLAVDAVYTSGEVPKEIRSAFWGLSVAKIYLRRLKEANYDPFDEGLQWRMKTTYPFALQAEVLKLRLLGL